jgi:DnaJ-class molecular chaperone
MSLYEILEIKSNASENEIRKAYHLLSKKYHPDKCKDDDSTDKFQKINSAYQILMDSKIREKYQKMNIEEKTNFQTVLEKIFKNELNFDDLKSFSIKFEKKDWNHLQNNFKDIINLLNFQELFNLFLNGDIPIKKTKISNCSDSDVDAYKEDNAEYYYDLPINYQRQNKLDIKFTFNITLNDILENTKKKIKIKRQFEDEESINTFIFNLNKPYVVFNNGGDMDDGDYGNLIIQLLLPKNFIWKENLIIYDYKISLYQMVYGLDIKLNIIKQIEYLNWVPSRDGFLIMVDDISLKNHLIAIKLSLDYEHSEEKENLLKDLFN